MSNIPSLDLNDFLSNDNKKKQDFVNAVGKAYQEIGFLSQDLLSNSSRNNPEQKLWPVPVIKIASN